jgi:hypothetical protein
MAVASSHVLLKDRVEHGQRARMSKNNPNLVGAKAVADIVKGVLVGPGRVTRVKELDIAKAESASQQKVVEFLDSLLTGFSEFQDIVGGTLDPLDLREKSLLGSATMLRVLAVVWHDLRYWGDRVLLPEAVATHGLLRRREGLDGRRRHEDCHRSARVEQALVPDSGLLGRELGTTSKTGNHQVAGRTDGRLGSPGTRNARRQMRDQ